MKLAFKYRFYPTKRQASLLSRTFGCVRYVYNFGLALRRDAYKERGERLRYKDTSAALTVLKKQEETSWLCEVSCVPLQQTLRHLDRAFTGFLKKRTGYPRFKRKHAQQAAEYTRRAFLYRVEEGTPVLRLAKMEQPLNVRWSRTPPSEPSTVTVSKDGADRYFVSLWCEVEPEPLSPTNKAVGIDLGLTDLVVTSDGFKSGNPKYLEHDLRKLRRAQRRLSKRQKDSNRYGKQHRKVAKIHARIRDKRHDYLHKLSTRLIRENQTVCLETLRVQNMMKNGRLARHIAGASWSELVRQLAYKAELYGRTVVRIDPWYPSSKRCSNCGHQAGAMPLSVRAWNCEICCAVHDRDVNAALNILAVGQTVIARGGNVRPTSVEGSNRAVNTEKGSPVEARILVL